MPPLGVDTPFGFSIDLSFWREIITWPSGELIRALFAIVGWAVLILVFFYMGSQLWLEYRRTVKYTRKWKWVLLAVDVPPLFIQTPKAVEQIFAHLSGALITPNIGQKYWMGKKQKWFSFEIVSIEGYIQFLIRTESEFRDLVEAAVYAQYTEAEITEVEDYMGNIPGHYPHPEYEIFGVEFALEENEAFPIRTYPSFEYNLSKDAVFSDPMAAILENFSRIQHGENFWMQIVIEPTSNKWKEKGIQLVKDVIAGTAHGGGHGGHGGGHGSVLLSKAADIPATVMKEAFNIWHWNFESESGHGEEHHEEVRKISDLTPGEKTTLEAIEEKISKIGFKSKIRALYSARKDIFNPSRCMDGLVGALNQFHIIGKNAIVPHHTTQVHYAFKQWREAHHKHHFMTAFTKRKIKALGNPYVLNIEELATIWHFPLPFVKTPLLQKAGAKRAEPPVELPVEQLEGPLKRVRPAVPKSTPPTPPEPPPAEILYG